MTKNEKLFPIRELSERTEVNTVTIRAWERRYGLLTPQRTEKGHRLYSEQDVDKVKSILIYMAKGVPVSKVKALLSQETTESQVTSNSDWPRLLKQLSDTLQQGSYLQIEACLKNLLLTYPVHLTNKEVFAPIFNSLDDSAAGLAQHSLLQNAIINYTLQRISSSQKEKQTSPVLLICALKTPIWKLALAATEIIDAGYSVNFINQACDTDTWLALTKRFAANYAIVFQEGVWRAGDAKKITEAVNNQSNIILCGTAAIIANIDSARTIADPEKILAHLQFWNTGKVTDTKHNN